MCISLQQRANGIVFSRSELNSTNSHLNTSSKAFGGRANFQTFQSRNSQGETAKLSMHFIKEMGTANEEAE